MELMKKQKDRKEILDNDLINYNPIEYGINSPIKNYSVRLEDVIPALSGIIGKTALVAAFAIAWSKSLGITDPTFITDNVRLEIIIGSLLTLIFSAVLNPYAAPPGTLAPLVPLIPLMAASGVHPLVFGVLVGALGLIISIFKFFDKVAELNGTAARGSIILLFGVMGIMSSVDSLSKWTANKSSSMFIVLIVLCAIVYLLLVRLQYKWLMIPAAALVGLVVSFLFGIYPEFKTFPSFPIIDPTVWWFDKWNLGWGISLINLLKAMPFALLAIVMWPTDALAIKTLQETNYGDKAKKSIFHMNSTFIAVSVRNIVGSILGGSQTAAIWRSFMIPLSIVRRPIGGSAFVMGVLGIICGLTGFPLDIAVFPPLIWLVLMFGIYIPLVEVGLNILQTSEQKQIASVTLLVGLALNPVLGWVIAIIVENLNIIKSVENKKVLQTQNVKMTLIVSLLVVLTYILSIVF
jgi:hypothetical protein